MKNNPNFSERLKELMYDCGDIKSERLGAEIGVSGQSVRGWCEGTQSISLSHLLKLADYFNCSLEFLLARSDIECDYTPRPCPPFYERFREVMKEKGVTRYRMAKESKIKDSYFPAWSRGADPNVDSVMEAADYLNVSIDYLVGRDR